MPGNPRATLLGLPLELRQNVFSNLLPKRSHEDQGTPINIATIEGCVQNQCPISWFLPLASSPVDLFLTCRQLYEECMDQLYYAESVSVHVTGRRPGCYRHNNWPQCIGSPREVKLWRFVRSLFLCVEMWHGRMRRETVLTGLREFSDGMSWGNNLKSLHIRIVVDEKRGMPGYYEEVLKIMRGWRIGDKGWVRVDCGINGEMTGEDEDYVGECQDLERVIRGEAVS